MDLLILGEELSKPDLYLEEHALEVLHQDPLSCSLFGSFSWVLFLFVFLYLPLSSFGSFLGFLLLVFWLS